MGQSIPSNSSACVVQLPQNDDEKQLDIQQLLTAPQYESASQLISTISDGSVIEWLGHQTQDLRLRVRLPVTTLPGYLFLRQVTVFGG